MASNKRLLKAFVRYDGTGRLISGSLILQAKKPKVGNWQEIDAYECCNPTTTTTTTAAPTTTTTTTAELAFRLLFENIVNAEELVTDPTSLGDWNTFFDLPTLGNAFTNVIVDGNEVKLYGGSNIKVKPAAMYNYTYLIEINDDAGSIVGVGGDAFSYNLGLTTVNLPECTIVYGVGDSPLNIAGGFGTCQNLTIANMPKLTTIGNLGFAQSGQYVTPTFNFPLLTSLETFGLASCNTLVTVNFPLLLTVGDYGFYECTALTTISLPSCTNLGSSVEFDDVVFGSIIGNTITLTVPSALMTANAGNPDEDIVLLQANNTVTVITT